ncbi:DNA invertase Pin-like site-specific DNA recombinase [Pseudarthrobacter oxydans]|uniref:DNA invertase Pin-like site-specific DNA recombinase n=1 Tax=Pseudarthrobacter oxydans TaxID=1671 RepID=A0AAW8NCJ4_PSEOX|nr:recombinase family protein [Pseudarthrobacter oxydans]MDR6794097.1 DNA invertase Pin-like site-specific DNA recombinase [Pseudarthrobacter oxydans]MDR7165307.1 DNA invertase Pin-like site-specific DNA recombinase [Pseudarthrobacter oxydans]
MSTTAVYVHQSEDRTGAEAAVQRQVAACRLLAEAKGWDSPRLYADNSISATPGKTRPAFEQLLAAVESGAVSAVVVWRLFTVSGERDSRMSVMPPSGRHFS